MSHRWHFILFAFLFTTSVAVGQTPADSSLDVGKKVITLSNVVISKGLNVPWFINRVKSDTGFYKAFRNLHLVDFSSINDIRMLDKRGRLQASLYSKTRQLREGNCRTMQVLEEAATGDIYGDDHSFNYYTAEMYASLFFTKGSVCGEDNIVGGREFSTEGKSGMEKHKEQLKMLFFNPGKRIKGIPFLSGKTPIYDDAMADCYEFTVDFGSFNNIYCYILKQEVKPGRKGDVVIDKMTTWFNDSTFEIVARNYELSYDAGLFDFKVSMEVELTKKGEWLLPSLIRYNGNWKAPFKRRERGIFTATLY